MKQDKTEDLFKGIIRVMAYEEFMIPAPVILSIDNCVTNLSSFCNSIQQGGRLNA